MRNTTKVLVQPKVVAATALAAAALLGGSAYAGTPSPSATAGSWAPPQQANVRLQSSSAQLAGCFPDAWAKVKVALTTDAVGKDEFTIKARGLKPKTDFTVFLIEKAGAPFGAVQYVGDFTTNRYGAGSNTLNLIVEEAFAFNNETAERTDLNSVGLWFADPQDDDGCLGATSPETGFDGDASAGVQMMNSGTHRLP